MNFFDYFNYSFTWIALACTILVSVMSGLLSPLIVLKEKSFTGDVLSHYIFPGLVIGYIFADYFNLPHEPCYFISALITALFGTWLNEKILRRLNAPHDAISIAFLSGFFALGILMVSRLKGTRVDLEKVLIGDVLTLNLWDLSLLLGVTTLVIIWMTRERKHLNIWLSDPEFGIITGFRIKQLNTIFPILLTVVILTGLFTIGGLMISALLAFPALLARPRQFFSWKCLGWSLFLGLIGFYLSFLLDLPTGPAAVSIGFIALLFKGMVKSYFNRRSAYVG